ncbi:hypothetical protein NW765_017586 [Fusarium oxysporum]|nr:hypothetical protein NW765_017586 [Fusarium oxysporum]KAJ4249725.1 hypothetical protein NW764_016488 [Fusarium oxysporum]
MAYATGAAHYHHLPLLRSAFKSLLEKIIHKMLLDDVWSYWFLTSHSGSKLDPDLKQLRQPWADPIVRENIMYSGHLLLMVSLYAMLFDDDKYNQKGALEFKWAPIFWGMGAEKFSYTRQTLQDAIINEMERENWLGVCCEPNSIFVVCNQFPLIALRYNDVREKTNVSSHVLERYLAAWKSKGMLHDHGLFVDRYCPAQDAKKPPKDVSFTAWALAFMNSWNPEFAYETSQKLHVGFLAKPTTRDHIIVTDPRIAIHIRRLAENEGKDPMDPSTFEEAAAIVDREPTEPRPYKKPEFGYAIQWISELGDRSTKDGMLSYADDTFNPTWVDGGLFYPTRPSETPHNYCTPFVDAVTGNAAIGYGRLNVQGGQRQMYANPWTDDHFENYPFVTNVDLSSGVDFLRGSWDDELHALCITMRSWNGKSKAVQPHLSGLKTGSYGLYVNGELSDVYEVPVSGSTIELNLSVSGEELDIVLLERV